MYCPIINGKCKGSECRDWDEDKQQCVVKTIRESEESARNKFDEMMQLYATMIESERFNTMFTRLMMNQLLKDPGIDAEVRSIIERALQAPSSEVARKLLEESGLI